MITEIILLSHSTELVIAFIDAVVHGGRWVLCAGFVMCACVCMWGICNVWVWVCVGFVMCVCVCVYVRDL